MPLRRRLSIIAAASVGIAILAAAVVCYLVVRDQLRGQVDDSLRAQMQAIQNQSLPLGKQLPTISPSAGGPAQYQQVVLYNGRRVDRVGGVSLPIDSATVDVIRQRHGKHLGDVDAGGSHLREITFYAQVQLDGPNGPVVPAAVQLARPLSSVDSTLSNLRLILLFVLIGGVFVAGTLGRIASRRVLKPLKEVERTAQHIAQTDDLSNRIHVHADDEVGRLASRFNQMLDRLQGSRNALDESVRAQRQLVADASHELRTPVTSLRTNIEILLQSGEMDDVERDAMLTDVVEQSEELAALVNDLIELARGEEPGSETDEVRLDWLAEEALARARRNAPALHFEATIEPALLDGAPERLGRALNNLLDNASRHSPPGGTIELYAGPGGVRVRDHGDGVDDADLPYLFDRFYRGKNSRGRQGSGLGLAIVRQVSAQHGGSASVVNAPDGGAVFTLRLPALAPDPHDPSAPDANHLTASGAAPDDDRPTARDAHDPAAGSAPPGPGDPHQDHPLRIS